MPPNCILEVDDVTKEWTYREKFDLIHLRMMIGAFTKSQAKEFYRQAYKHLKPGGWIEQVEICISFTSADNTILPDSALAKWGYVQPRNNKCQADINADLYSMNVPPKWEILLISTRP